MCDSDTQSNFNLVDQLFNNLSQGEQQAFLAKYRRISQYQQYMCHISDISKEFIGIIENKISKNEIKIDSFINDNKEYTNDFYENLFAELVISQNPTEQELEKNSKIIDANFYALYRILKNYIETIGNNEKYLILRDNIMFELCTHLSVFNNFLGRYFPTKYLNLEEKLNKQHFVSSVHFFNYSREKIYSCKNGSSVAPYVHSPALPNIENSCIPFYLRASIEVYFKNLIGYLDAEVKNEENNTKEKYILNISKLISFFENKRYKKYIIFPDKIDIKIIKMINKWSNSFIHSGVPSFCWQSIIAADYLYPFFCPPFSENGFSLVEGYNYLDRNYQHSHLIQDLEEYLSSYSKKRVTITYVCFDEKDKPLEGCFYHTKNK